MKKILAIVLIMTMLLVGIVPAYADGFGVTSIEGVSNAINTVAKAADTLDESGSGFSSVLTDF